MGEYIVTFAFRDHTQKTGELCLSVVSLVKGGAATEVRKKT